MSPICLSLIQVLSFYILPFPTPVFCPEMIFSTRVSFDPEMSQWKFEMQFSWEKDQDIFFISTGSG